MLVVNGHVLGRFWPALGPQVILVNNQGLVNRSSVVNVLRIRKESVDVKK